MKGLSISLIWLLFIVFGTLLATLCLTTLTPLGEQVQALAVTVAGDVICNGCVGINTDGTNDIKDSSVTKVKMASNSIDGSKISDDTIGAADLAPDSVGASELKGVTKLIFGSCKITLPGETSGIGEFPCKVTGARSGDHILATLNNNLSCNERPVLHHAFATTTNDIVNIGLNYYTIGCPNTVNVSVLAYR